MEYFVLGIGGTGMRCIESFIHLCAMGMLDDTTVHLLALDTDKNNGNFARLKAVKDAYLNVKDLDSSNRTTGKDCFFSANLKYYEFSPNYEQKSTFKDVFGYDDTHYNNRNASDLADLVFSGDVEEFNLRHGYRAQTHLGSMMMYHSIIEAAQSDFNNDLKRFLQSLIAASSNGKPRVFILGSVFGGTGASSIPIIPQAIAKAAGIISKGASNVMQNAYFGSTLLTAYFKFNLPSATERKEQKIIATSDKFALNSQVAMMFYQDDATVQTTYQKFYMIGTPGMDWDPMPQKTESGAKTITGGSEQKNDSHYIELFAACAALDFLKVEEDVLQTNKTNKKADYQYRSINDNGKMEFQDFVGQARAEEFAKKMSMLTILSILCNNPIYDFVSSLQNGAAKISGFEDVNPEQIKNLKDYFALYHFKAGGDDVLSEGWLRQLHRSAGGSDKFLFAAEMFAPQTVKEQTKSDWNQPFRNEGVCRDNGFSVKLFGNKYDKIKENFLKVYDGKDDMSASFTNRHEQMLKRIYDTLISVYKF